MAKRTVEQVERLVDSLNRIDVNEIDFGKVVKHNETENHEEVRELSQTLRMIAAALQSAETRYANTHFMEDQLHEFYEKFNYDPAKITERLAKAMGDPDQSKEDRHEEANHDGHGKVQF